MAYAAFVSPDGEPEGAYFADKVRNNVAMLEGEHGVALSVKDTADRTVAYDYGKVEQYAQSSNPSPLGAWRADDCSGPTPWRQVGCYATPVNNMTAAAYGAEATFMEGFLLGHVRHGEAIGNCRHHALIAVYGEALFSRSGRPQGQPLPDRAVCLSHTNRLRVGGRMGHLSKAVCAPAGGWRGNESREDTDNAYGLIAMSALSYMAGLSVDEYRGQAVWQWFYSNRPHLRACSNFSPKFCIKPLAADLKN